MTIKALGRAAQSHYGKIFRVPGSRRMYSRKIVQENDIVLLKRKDGSKGGRRAEPILTKPLIPDSKVPVDKSKIYVSTNDIIGKQIRDVVNSNRRSVAYRIIDPTFEEYISLSSRLVTPIYSADANLIVSLLDLHPTAPPSAPWPFRADQDDEKLEIFEAGTGHGALTLHLARAIHGANIRPPSPLTQALRDAHYDADPAESVAITLKGIKDSALELSKVPGSINDFYGQLYQQQLSDYVRRVGHLGAVVEFSVLAKDEAYSAEVRELFFKLAEGELPMPERDSAIFEQLYEEKLDRWRSRRRAVVHTLDINPNFSKHAQGVVKNFRQGMYFNNVDFHVETIESHLSTRLQESGGEPFYDHAILDLPDTHENMELLASCLKTNGALITWNPSITQVLKCVDIVREKKLPLLLEKVLEMGVGGGTGGRQWEIRRVRMKTIKVRETSQPEADESYSDEASEEKISEEDLATGEIPIETEGQHTTDQKTPDEEVTEDNIIAKSPSPDEDARYEMICRPKVGVRVEGGGFIGLWRRMEQH